MLARLTSVRAATRALPRASAARVAMARANVAAAQRSYAVAATSAGFSGLDSVPGKVENVGEIPNIKDYKHGGKFYPTAAEAVKDIESGSMILSAGFGLCGTAETLITALHERPELKDLTVVSNNAGNVGQGGLCEYFGLGRI